jgi:succinyl-CoA synthetase alpha subunit
VTAEVAKADPKAVTVRFTAKDKFPAGPVRIVGKAGGLTRRATAALADFGTTVEELWLAPAGDAAPAKKPKK